MRKIIRQELRLIQYNKDGSYCVSTTTNYLNNNGDVVWGEREDKYYRVALFGKGLQVIGGIMCINGAVNMGAGIVNNSEPIGGEYIDIVGDSVSYGM